MRGAHQDDGQRDDVVAHDLRTWAFRPGDARTMQLVRVPFVGRSLEAPHPIRELAFSQLCTRIGAPPSYVRTLPPKLQTACMNDGLSHEKSPALLQLAAGELRAVLSDRYSAADDVSDALNRCGYRSAALVRVTAVGPHTLLRIIIPNEGDAVKPGDIVEHGIGIGNSELGLRSVQVTPVT